VSIPFEQGRDLWAKRKVIASCEEVARMVRANGEPIYSFGSSSPISTHVPLEREITILDVDIDPGSDACQIGDYTWDTGEDPYIEIIYKLSGYGDQRLSVHVELDFGTLVQEIVGVAEEILKE
jgi:hypothetical protein